MGDLLFKIFLLFISLPLVFFTIAGNLLVLLGYIFHAPLRTPSNAYLVSLALADLLTGLFIFPPTIHYSYVRSWIWGLPTCRAWLTLLFAMCPITAFHLVAIAIDRYRTVTEGVSYIQRRTMRSVWEKLVLIWTIGFWVTIPVVLDWEHIATDPTAERHCVTNKIPYWVTHYCGASFVFPAVCMGRIYYQVYSAIKGKLRNKRNALAEKEFSGVTESSSDGGVIENPGLLPVPNSGRYGHQTTIMVDASKTNLLARERRTAFTVVIISGAFILCWLPWHVLSIYEAMSSGGVKPSPYLYTFSGIFGLANSCINPIVYAARMPEFMTVFKKILRIK